MSPTQEQTPGANADGSKILKTQRTVFNLDTMDEVTLVKRVTFVPVKTTEEALARLGNSTEKFLAVINDGLESETTAAALKDAGIPWMEIDEATEDEKPFNGTVADSATVNGLILNMAKSMFGYSKEMKREEKRAAKESATEIIRSTPVIRERLVEQAKASK